MCHIRGLTGWTQLRWECWCEPDSYFFKQSMRVSWFEIYPEQFQLYLCSFSCLNSVLFQVAFNSGFLWSDLALWRSKWSATRKVLRVCRFVKGHIKEEGELSGIQTVYKSGDFYHLHILQLWISVILLRWLFRFQERDAGDLEIFLLTHSFCCCCF